MATGTITQPISNGNSHSVSSMEPVKKKRRARDKLSKGLRHFSTRVCKKVEEKGKTSFNEVADEIVRDFINSQDSTGNGKPHNEKNIRRRVYDALNVLMAMNVITKKRKAIVWKGLPSNAHHDLELLKRRKNALENSVKDKKLHLQELLLQAVTYRSLVTRNKTGRVKSNKESRIAVPFIMVNTKNQTKINLEMSENRQDIFFNFSSPFEIHDYNEILKSLNLELDRDQIESVIPAEMLHLLPSDVYQASSPGTTPTMAARMPAASSAAAAQNNLYPAANRNSATFDGAASLLTMHSSPSKRKAPVMTMHSNATFNTVTL